MKNIALIGMPGCGKTSTGEILANRLNMDFIDIDAEIIKSSGREIPEIFKSDGEAYFRKLESEQIVIFSKLRNIVISAGGGAVLAPENMECLKETGIIIFLDRDPEDILNTELRDRPLLTGDRREKLYELYNKRLPLYKKYADIEIKAVDSIEKTAELMFKRVMEEME